MNGRLKKEWMSSDELHYSKGTTRPWLRQMWKEGKIRRREITGTMHDGSVRTKYLYNVEDVERVLQSTESTGTIEY